MLENLNQIWGLYNKYIIIVAFILISLIYSKIVMGKAKGHVGNFLRENPNAGKVYVKNENSFFSNLFGFGKVLNVLSVDGINGSYWNIEGKDKVYYFLPGERKLGLAYQSIRPGIIHRSVTKTYQASDVAVTIEDHKTYLLSFDKNSERFNIKEI